MGWEEEHGEKRAPVKCQSSHMSFSPQLKTKFHCPRCFQNKPGPFLFEFLFFPLPRKLISSSKSFLSSPILFMKLSFYPKLG